MFSSLIYQGQDYCIKGIFIPFMGIKCLHTTENLQVTYILLEALDPSAFYGYGWDQPLQGLTGRKIDSDSGNKEVRIKAYRSLD